MTISLKPRKIICLLPYLFLLILGGWYRAHSASIALWDGDTEHYLDPVVCKQFTGIWHKGERPMQYLMFMYYALLNGYQLKNIVILQKIFFIIGAVLLTGAWLVFTTRLRHRFLAHLAGYVMLGIYISSPVLMYYEALIGPESFCMFVMCVVIFCLSVVFTASIKPVWKGVFWAIVLFVNLYLSNPMPKCILACFLTEIVYIVLILRSASLSKGIKTYTLLVPHILFAVFVILPERINKIDKPSEDRLYIEFEQMAYTHFDLLVQNRSDFGLPVPLQDSLVNYYTQSAKRASHTLIGFYSDDLMWGKAAETVSTYYHMHNHDDSIGMFYKRLNFILATKYPLSLSREIIRQTGAFYLPNNIIHKDLFDDMNMEPIYQESKNDAEGEDSYLLSLNEDPVKKASYIKPRMFSSQYAATAAQAGVFNYSMLPLVFQRKLFIYSYFDYIFITVMVFIFVLWLTGKRGGPLNFIILLYAIIFFYTSVIAIVHSFDVDRFIITIYPFILIATFCATLYICDETLAWLKKARSNRNN